jgi:hypothetical protein
MAAVILRLLQEHLAKDDLVAWGWNPGEGREPAWHGDNDFTLDDGGGSVDQEGIVRNLAEALRPVVTVAGKHLGGVVGDVKLKAIAIELNLMNPGVAGRDLFNRSRQCRFNETRDRRLDADSRWLFALERHCQTRRIGSGNWTL